MAKQLQYSVEKLFNKNTVCLYHIKETVRIALLSYLKDYKTIIGYIKKHLQQLSKDIIPPSEDIIPPLDLNEQFKIEDLQRELLNIINDIYYEDLINIAIELNYSIRKLPSEKKIRKAHTKETASQA